MGWRSFSGLEGRFELCYRLNKEKLTIHAGQASPVFASKGIGGDFVQSKDARRTSHVASRTEICGIHGFF
jgi:hypothetical protein